MRLILLLAVSLQAQTVPYVNLSGEWLKEEAGKTSRVTLPFLSLPTPIIANPTLGPGEQPFGQYRLKRTVALAVEARRGDLAIAPGAIRGSYRISVNGAPLGGPGTLGSAWPPTPVPRSYPVPREALGEQLEIVIDVDNPQYFGYTKDWTAVAAPVIAPRPVVAKLVLADLREWQGKAALFPVWLCADLLFAALTLLAGWRGSSARSSVWLALAFLASAIWSASVLVSVWAYDWVPDAAAKWPVFFLVAPLTCFVVEFAVRYVAWPYRKWTPLLYVFLIAAFYLPDPRPDMVGRLLVVILLLEVLHWAIRTKRRDGAVAMGILTGYQTLILSLPLGVIPVVVMVGPLAVATPPLFRVLFGLLMVVEMQRRATIDRDERQRLAEELEAARQVQSLLLSSALMGDLRGYRVESSYLPAREVGGDFYQVWESDRGVMVAVGDVSGKGLKAAMMVSLVVGALRQQTSDEPAVILRGLNGVLHKSGEGAGFVTCCVLRLENDGPVVVANAGHLPPYADGVAVELEGSLPLGIDADADYTETRIAAAGQWMLVSDGVVEAATAQGELFGFDRTAAMSARAAAELVEAARAWGQNDDITVVTVRRPS